MTIFLTIIHIIVCLTLVLVILLQAGRGQGLGGASFGGGNVQSVLGTRSADFMTKATTVAAICFLLTSIGLDILEVKKSRSLLEGLQQDSSIDVSAIQKALEKIQDGDVKDAVLDGEGAIEAVTTSEEAPVTQEDVDKMTEKLEASTQELGEILEEGEKALADAAKEVEAKTDEMLDDLRSRAEEAPAAS